MASGRPVHAVGPPGYDALTVNLIGAVGLSNLATCLINEGRLVEGEGMCRRALAFHREFGDRR